MVDKRIWFSKTGMLKYISHLDFSRYMSRTLKMTGLPLWYTEGFNPHLHMVFTQPLSLGMIGVRESLDVRITQPVTNEEILKALCVNPINGLCFYAVTDPEMKPGDVSYAEYEIVYSTLDPKESDLGDWMERFTALDEMVIEKKSKSGSKPFDLAPYIRQMKCACREQELTVSVTLPAGSQENVNPRLLGDAFSAFSGMEIFQEITRKSLLNAEKQIFK